ncbi:MAG: mevalonate kinase [Elusimicrobia bacterium]|nr:mevalonate kinase [Elusimicrobiota bacterium]
MTRAPAFTARAPSKLILLGEHAVVYGHPAVAVPLGEPFAQATARLVGPGGPVGVELQDFGLAWLRGSEPSAEEARPFSRIVEICVASGMAPDNGWTLTVRSAVPIGCGLGSGAAVAAASFKAVYGLFGARRCDRELCSSVYEVEKLLHGTPSGVDNTVIAYGRPVLFRKGEAPTFLSGPGAPLFLAVADTGLRHKTAEVVAEVARLRSQAAALLDEAFRGIGALAREGAAAFEKGDLSALGRLMNEDHRLLRGIGVSAPDLERLVAAARKAGALGAKLCGAGRGGCMAALADSPEASLRLAEALLAAGAKHAFASQVSSPAFQKVRP